MPLLTLSHVDKFYGAEQVLDDVSCRVERGAHVGLVGVNGAGKSTLLRIMAGVEVPDAGETGRERGLRVVYLEQEPDFGGAETVYDAMLSLFADTIAAQQRLADLEAELARGTGDLDEYGRLQALIEHTGYGYRDRIEQALVGLEIGPDLWHVPIGVLSGGQRTRVNLARTLLTDADLLLLDEPTNHPDIPAVEWLEGYLRDLKRAFVIVAHDRYLLDRVTQQTFELSFRRLAVYDAPYSRYLALKAEQIDRQRQEYEAQQRHIAKTEDFIRRYGAGQRSKEARGREKRLARLERVERPEEEGAVHLHLGRARRSGDIVLEARNLIVGYREPLVHLPEDVTVRRGDRIAIVGPNGCGKTSLLRTLVATLPPLRGEVRWGANTSIAYYSQTLEGLDGTRTVLDEVRAVRPMSEEEARGYLGRFLFTNDDAFKTVAVLSGGEKSRVALAKLILEVPNVLVLDEPTNHLDIASRDALQDVLDEFGGTILFVSHDRYLIDSLARRLWVVADGRLNRYEGTYSAFVAGTAAPLDRRPTPRGDTFDGLPPEERVEALTDELRRVAGRLDELGPGVSLRQLDEMTGRMEELQEAIQEAQRAWLRQARKSLESSA